MQKSPFALIYRSHSFYDGIIIIDHSATVYEMKQTNKQMHLLVFTEQAR